LQTFPTSFANEIFVARRAFEAYLIISAAVSPHRTTGAEIPW
jgi:hypothetical protein